MVVYPKVSVMPLSQVDQYKTQKPSQNKHMYIRGGIPKGPCKRTHQVPTTPNIFGCCWPTMLRPFSWAYKSLIGFKLYTTGKCQQVPTLLWFHANGRNKSQHCWAQECWVLQLANNVGSVCMGLLKVISPMGSF